jgi:hypothetical protein
MKTIELKVGKEEINGKQTFFTTWDVLKMAVNNPEQGGFNVEEMMKRLRLLEKLDEHKDTFFIQEGEFTDDRLERKAILELEDTDFEKLKTLFSQVKWTVVSKFIIDLNKELSSK